MIRWLTALILGNLMILSLGCHRPPCQFELPYQLDDADKKYKLPGKLNEVSGMTHLGDQKVAVIEDERGIIYTFSLKSGEIKEEIDLGVAGDFEGLTQKGNYFFAMTSNGEIYSVSEEDVSAVKGIFLPSGKSSEIEGFCYSATKEKFILAYKSPSGIGTDARSIYLYEEGKSMHAAMPYFTITNQKIKTYLKRSMEENTSIKKIMNEKAFGEAIFQPSGIAQHPLTGHLYVLSGVNELLMVIDPEAGRICYLYHFTKNYLSQPEGIAFDNDGDLYIASEKGSGDRAYIVRYEMDDNSNQ